MLWLQTNRKWNSSHSETWQSTTLKQNKLFYEIKRSLNKKCIAISKYWVSEGEVGGYCLAPSEEYV